MRERTSSITRSLLAVGVCLALGVAALPVGDAYAQGKGKRGPGGDSAPNMSQQGMENTNSPASSDPDKGLERARERMSEEGLEHSKAQQEDQPADDQKGKGKKKAKHKAKSKHKDNKNGERDRDRDSGESGADQGQTGQE